MFPLSKLKKEKKKNPDREPTSQLPGEACADISAGFSRRPSLLTHANQNARSGRHWPVISPANRGGAEPALYHSQLQHEPMLNGLFANPVGNVILQDMGEEKDKVSRILYSFLQNALCARRVAGA